jgi:hypothetical protein
VTRLIAVPRWPAIKLALSVNTEPFESFKQWEWEWLRADLSQSQIEEGLTEAFEHSSNPSHSLVFQVLDAARQRVENGLRPYGKLWEKASEEERLRYMEESRRRVASYND